MGEEKILCIMFDRLWGLEYKQTFLQGDPCM